MPSPSDRCAKCGNSQIIPGARVACNVQGGDQNVKLRIDSQPGALIFKQAQRSALRASICGKCGYTEFFADDPASLYTAYLESQKSSL